MVWSVIGWFFAGLFILLLLLLFLPLSIAVRYGAVEGFTAHVHLFFIPLRVFPLPAFLTRPKKEKPQKAKAEKKPSKKKKKEKPPQTTSQKINFVKRLGASGQAAMKVFFRHLRIRNVRLVLPVCAEDAAETAKTCGTIQASIGAFRGVTENFLRIQYKQLELIPDFAGQQGDKLFFTCKLVFNPCIIFPMAFAFFKRYLQKRPYSRAVYKQALKEKMERKKKAA